MCIKSFKLILMMCAFSACCTEALAKSHPQLHFKQLHRSKKSGSYFKSPADRIASMRHRPYLTIAASALNLSYKEFRNSGQVLDKENGTIPGFNIILHHKLAHATFDITGAYYNGNLTYTGGVWGGEPMSLSFLDKHRIYYYAMKLAYPLTTGKKNLDMRVFAQLGHRHWDRGTDAHKRIGDYQETYVHNELLIGLDTQFFTKYKCWFDLKLGYGGTMNVLLSVYDIPISAKKLGEKPLYQASFQANYQFSRRLAFNATASYRYFKYGRSSVDFLGVYEPDSQTKSLQLSLGIHYRL